MDPCALFWLPRAAALVKLPTDTCPVYVYEYDSDESSADSWETRSPGSSGRASEVEYDSDSEASEASEADSVSVSDFEPVRDGGDSPSSERDPVHDFEPGRQYVPAAARAGFVCSICCDSGADSVCQLASCQHEFHLCCIRPWAVRHASCPLCRGSL